MRFHHGTAAGLIAVGLIVPTGLAGCAGTDHAPGAATPSAAASAASTTSPAPEGRDPRKGAPERDAIGNGAAENGTTERGAAEKGVNGGSRPAPGVPPGAATAVRLAAGHYYAVSAAGQFPGSWRLLTPAARRVIPQGSWTGVHRACPSAGVGKHRVIKSVTLFGNAAIVLTTVAGAPKKTGVLADVFSLTDGHWAYSPGYLGIYGRGSVGADTAAARKAGLCGGWKNF